MAKFTGGTVSYLRRVNTGNYEHKEFTAAISWSAEDGDDPLWADECMERAADVAMAVVHQRLGLVEKPVPASPTAAQVQARAAHNADPETRHAVAIEEKPELAASAPGRVRRTKAEIAAGISLEEAAAARAGRELPEPKPRPQPLLTGADPLADEPTTEEPIADEAISNDELVKAANAAVARLQDALPVRKLIAGYATQLSAIAPEKRAAFLAELKAL